MIRLMTAALTLGVIMAIATPTAQAQDDCFWVGCNPEAGVCRLLCGHDDPRQTEIGSQWHAPYGGPYPGAYQSHRTPHWHAKHHHKTGH
jgi:hypothetical protein